VAVKMLKVESPTTMESAAAAEEMRRELEIMRSLKHDNVVKVKGVLHDHNGN